MKPRLDVSAYEMLGLATDADAHAIKQAYYRIARTWHPDVSTHADAKEVFGHISRAHEILTHPQQRVVYDFALMNGIPLAAPERFQSFYGRVRHIDFVARNHRALGWAFAGAFTVLCAGMRVAWWRRQHAESACASINAGETDGPRPRSGAAEESLLSPTEPPMLRPALPPAPILEAPRVSAAAIGGLIGTMGGGGAVVACGAAGSSGARYALAAALCGGLGGRVALPWVDRRVRGLKSLRTRTAEMLVDYSRPLCELISAAAAIVITRRMYPALLLGDAHLRFLRAGTLGAVAGHGLGRAATRANHRAEH